MSSSNDRLTRAIALSRARKPSDEAVARMRSSLVLAASSANAAPAVKTLKIASFKAWLAGGVVVGAALVGAGIAHHRAAPVEPTTVRTITATAVEAPPAPTPTVIESVAIEDLPRADPPVRAANKPLAAPDKDKDTEVALVTAAEKAMPSDPATALALAEKHAAKFPNGELLEEREVLAIEALAALGRSGDARARADRFLASSPRTPYRARVGRATGP
jgi:hypothetical protein